MTGRRGAHCSGVVHVTGRRGAHCSGVVHVTVVCPALSLPRDSLTRGENSAPRPCLPPPALSGLHSTSALLETPEDGEVQVANQTDRYNQHAQHGNTSVIRVRPASARIADVGSGIIAEGGDEVEKERQVEGEGEKPQTPAVQQVTSGWEESVEDTVVADFDVTMEGHQNEAQDGGGVADAKEKGVHSATRRP